MARNLNSQCLSPTIYYLSRTCTPICQEFDVIGIFLLKRMADDDEFAPGLIVELRKPPALLPIAQLKTPILYAIETYPVTIVVGLCIATDS